MTRPPSSRPRRPLHQLARAALSRLPRQARFALFRRMIDCDPAPDPRLRLGIARTAEDLSACYSLLHDAYVSSGFMKPHPSGLRVTPYHALPTTTTLMARYDGEVVGTLTIIREGVFGFPLQSIFDLHAVRARSGRIAEISALAVHPRFRNTGGTILFPLMKFMYEYCTAYFDTRHLVIAVNPNRIELYEALLFFDRLQQQVIDNYDFANGAPAIGATLDLQLAPEMFRAAYAGRKQRKDMHRYFTDLVLPNIEFPQRPFHTTNDPVMSPALLDEFFNRRTQVFAELDDRRRRLLHAIYPEPAWQEVLPTIAGTTDEDNPLRRHRRYSLKCPARWTSASAPGEALGIEVIDVSRQGFLARVERPLPDGSRGEAQVELGEGRSTTVEAVAVRRVLTPAGTFHGFRMILASPAWQACIAELEARDAPAGECAHVRGSADLTEDWSVHDIVAA
jgi:GNAT superfamily N-acetyltransferase